MLAPSVSRQNETERLSALYELNILDTSPEERFDRIVRLAAQFFDVPTAYIAFLDAERQWFKARYGLSATQTPRNISFCTHTIQQDGPLVVPDALLDSRFSNSPLVIDNPHTRFYAGYPLSTPGGFKVGTLCVTDQKPRDIQPEHLILLQDLASLAQDQLTLIDIAKLQQQLRFANEALEKRNDFIKKAFSCYMSNEIVERLLESSDGLQLGGEQRRITAMFCDLRGFTPLSERLPAEKVVAALNTYFGKMVDIILKHGGTIDAFIGDAIMVLFGAPCANPDDALRAVACAVEMQLAMDAVNTENKNHELPELSMGIGINTGVAVVGNIGSEKRMKYSAIGAPVNLAARIQEFSLGGQILISETTLQESKHAVRIDGHLRVKVKGIQAPVTIYDIGGVSGEHHLYLESR